MKEKELLDKALKFYQAKDKELIAIEAFTNLLSQYPDNDQGWAHLSTMQMQISDYDKSIYSINKAIQINPDNSWYYRQKATLQRHILNYPSEDQNYFNDQTKEAYLVEAYESRNELHNDYDKTLNTIIKLEPQNEKVVFETTQQIARNHQEIGNYEIAIQHLEKSKSAIPKSYSERRKTTQSKAIENRITNNIIELGRYKEAIIRLEKQSSEESDRYFIKLKIAELYDKLGNKEKSDELIGEAYIENETRIIEEPEVAYLVRKFELLKLMDNSELMNEIFSNYDEIKVKNEFTEKRINEIKLKIENYRQQ